MKLLVLFAAIGFLAGGFSGAALAVVFGFIGMVAGYAVIEIRDN